MLEIINQKNMNFLLEISKKPRNISELAKIGDLALSVASTLISRWARSGVIIKTRSDGERSKETIITLTEYGKAQVKLLRGIKKNYYNNKNAMKKIELLDASLIETTEKGGEKCRTN